jgi:hypothetical protein
VALTVPASARAGEPDGYPGSGAPYAQSADLPACKHKYRHALCSKCREWSRAQHRNGQHARGPQLCARCMAKAYPGMTIRDPNSGTYVAGTSCTACQSGMNGTPVYPGQGDAGYASVGLAPGMSLAGGTVLSTDPAPVGVMRASYPPASAPGYAVVGTPPGSANAAGLPGAASAVPPAPEIIGGPPHRRPLVLVHLFGLDALGAHRRERLERESEKHAAISYGQLDQNVTELPASVVYGK